MKVQSYFSKLKKKNICQSNIPTSFRSHQESTANDTLKAQERADN